MTVMEGIGKEVEVKDQDDRFIEGSKVKVFTYMRTG